jgi:parallel beta-helix repeat protein
MYTPPYTRYISLFIIVILLGFIFTGCKKSDDHPTYTYYDDFTFEEPAVTGNTFYIDPANGSPAGDGSASHPWRTLQEVIDSGLIECYAPSEAYHNESELKIINEGAPVKGGDKLVLRSGYHGFINVSRFVFNDWLTILAEEGQTPVFSQIKMVGAFKNIYLKNLSIIKESYVGGENYWETDDINYNTGDCLYLGSSEFWGKGSYVKVYGLTLKTTENASAWTAADWVEKSASGITLRSAEHIEIVNCRLENVRFGINIEYFSDYSTAVGNTVKYYSGDGSRIISNNVLFAYNTIEGCLKVDDNHDDGIQSYTRGADDSPGAGVLYNVTIRGNLIIGIADKNNPLSGSPQGIGCFDGLFKNWTVENNVIISNTYHGISFYGMIDSKIINNTVIDQVPGDDVCPWIMITDHKNGTPSSNCIVANNIVSSDVSVSGRNVMEYNNYVFGKENYNAVYDAFKNTDENDLHLLINDFTRTNLIDKGVLFDGLVSSASDIEENSRSGLPDLGAYEADE